MNKIITILTLAKSLVDLIKKIHLWWKDYKAKKKEVKRLKEIETFLESDTIQEKINALKDLEK